MHPRRLIPLSIVLLLAVLGCRRNAVLDLADFAHHQRDQVTTRLVPAHDPLAARLATDGWRLETEREEGTVLRMTRDRSRVWFYSANGAATSATLHGGFPGSDAEARPISYRVNGEHQAIARWKPQAETLELPFKGRAARVGWNALDIYVKRGRGEEPLELEGLRFGDSSVVVDEAPRSIAIEGGELYMPSESVLEASFEVPEGARLQLRGVADSDGRGPAEAQARLMGSDGTWMPLSTLRLDPGEKGATRASLEEWTGEVVTLQLSVRGPRSAGVRWLEAAVSGGGEPVDARAPVRPAAAEASGRLGRPDVFLVVLDAARADAFGTYGAPYPTPAVDGLATEGTRYERALAPSSWTGQSIPALLAGFHPDTLGTERWGDALPDTVPTMAELMAGAGYRTVLWSQHPIYNRADSLVRGFEQVRYSGRRRRDRLPSRQLLFERERPTFALVHLLPPHSPYAPPEPFRGSYTADYSGTLPAKLGALGRIGKKRALRLTEADHTYIRGRYLENVAFADYLVGQLVGHLRATRRYRNSLIIVTSDHGEAFFEHGQFMHSRELYPEFIQIPLVVKWPATAAGHRPSIEAAVSLTDLLPTLVDGLGLSGADRGFQGRSLVPATFDGALLERAIYATTRGLGDVTKTAKPRWMLEQGNWRVIHDPIADRTELFDRRRDPLDLEDVSAVNPTLARQLLGRLLMQRRFNLDLLQLGRRDEVELDPAMVEELKALGYL